MYKLIKTSGKARIGLLKTIHSQVQTPFFMPVATKGSVKYIAGKELTKTGTEAVICNSFILSLTPGAHVIEKCGGLHKYTGFAGTIFTDSGGFQVLSDDFCKKLTEKGVYFKDLINDGKVKLYTPEEAVGLQERLGSDVMMCLDDVPKHNASKERTIDSMKRTSEWAKRCLKTRKNKKRLLFGIAQGGTYPELRRESTESICSMGFDGISLGGLCIGETREKMKKMIELSNKIIPKDIPRYLMGVGSPEDLVEAVGQGVDIFDSAFPTQNVRHGTLFTFSGRIKIFNRKYRDEAGPIEEGCDCIACQNYSSAFIANQLRNNEGAGYILATRHNIRFMQRLIGEIRTAISEERFESFRRDFGEKYRRK